MADEISTAEPHGADTAKRDVETVEQTPAKTADATPSVPSGTMDPAHRVRVERALLRKLDTRCSLFVLIYIVSEIATIRLSDAKFYC